MFVFFGDVVVVVVGEVSEVEGGLGDGADVRQRGMRTSHSNGQQHQTLWKQDPTEVSFTTESYGPHPPPPLPPPLPSSGTIFSRAV